VRQRRPGKKISRREEILEEKIRKGRKEKKE
jgi:hypothetical protein